MLWTLFTFGLAKERKAQVALITLMMAAFHLAEPVSGLWYLNMLTNLTYWDTDGTALL